MNEERERTGEKKKQEEATFTLGSSDGFAVQPSFWSQTSRVLLHGNCYQGN